MASVNNSLQVSWNHYNLLSVELDDKLILLSCHYCNSCSTWTENKGNQRASTKLLHVGPVKLQSVIFTFQLMYKQTRYKVLISELYRCLWAE